ncbi:MAG: DUF1847 domain-containing protein [Deltaproteobacteria bacterium]|nr:DUF1847 domain-containing protein [Deltaproteobacteria bacterium]
MKPYIGPQCARCAKLSCTKAPGTEDPPAGCPMRESAETLARVERLLREDESLRELACNAARTEAGGYCRMPRIEEICDFARRSGVKRIGIASCVGTQREAALAQTIFEAQGFQVCSAVCKVGAIAKEEVGLTDEEKIRPGGFEALCNPVAQARLLDEAGCGLAVLVGLCVGHDSLFFRHSRAPVTVLLAKDRVCGHNPAAALYTSHSYYRRLK